MLQLLQLRLQVGVGLGHGCRLALRNQHEDAYRWKCVVAVHDISRLNRVARIASVGRIEGECD
jgi:hypothetical protein